MSNVRRFQDARTREISLKVAAGDIDNVDAIHLMQERIDALVASYEGKVADLAAETLRTGELMDRIAELEALLREAKYPSMHYLPHDDGCGLCDLQRRIDAALNNNTQGDNT